MVIVAVVLFVAVFVIIVAVRLLPTPQIVPRVLFGGTVGVRPGTFEVEVREVRGYGPLEAYRVQLVNETDPNVRVQIFPSPQAVLDGPIGGGQGVLLSFEDRSGVGSFTPGDAFVLEGVAPGTTYVIHFIRVEDGSVVWAARIP